MTMPISAFVAIVLLGDVECCLEAAERIYGEKHGTEGRDRSGKKRSLRIGKASGKAIKNMLAGTVLGDKLRAKGLTWVPEKKEPPKKED
jgi:hypothetical protein